LLDIQSHLGGNTALIPYKARTNAPAFKWELVGWSNLTGLLPHLCSGKLPAKKARDMNLLYELCRLRITWSYNLSKDHVAILEKYYLALREIKRYKGSGG
jgi:hypothetical protein